MLLNLNYSDYILVLNIISYNSISCHKFILFNNQDSTIMISQLKRAYNKSRKGFNFKLFNERCSIVRDQDLRRVNWSHKPWGRYPYGIGARC